MLAAVLHAPENLTLEQVPVPVPGPGELLLKVEANTLCGTDGRLLSGEKTLGVKPGVTPGHEFAGRIVAVGDGVVDYQVGKQAVMFPIVTCGHCDECKAGQEQLCSVQEIFGYAIDGGLAEYCLVPRLAVQRGNLIQLEEEMTPAGLALVEPVSCCLHGMNQYRVELGDTVLIFGAGPIGLIHAQLARAAGAAQVIVTNRSAGRRDIALELGATHTIDPADGPLVDEVKALTNGRGADVVVVCVGVPELANQALQAVRKGGRVNYFAGFPRGSTAVMDPNLIHYDEIQVSGGSGANRQEAAQAVDLIRRGVINAERMITHRFPLSQIEQAYKAMTARQGIKVVVTP